MEIKYRDIVLRDVIEADIEDWIRWDSVETEWMNWDAPDEPTETIEKKFTAAIGIDICDSHIWGNGYGTQAIAAFIQHFLAQFGQLLQFFEGKHLTKNPDFVRM